MRSFFIVNPVAGSGRGRRVWEAVLGHLQATETAYEVEFTRSPGAATELARRAVESGHRRIVALGGDGTLSEVVRGIAGSDVTLGLVPGGTGNDFVRSLSIPRDPVAATHIALGPHSRAVDLPRVNGMPFLNVAGVGFDAEVAAEMNRRRSRLQGAIPYLLTVLRMLTQYRNTPVQMELDGQRMEAAILLVAVGNGRYCAGGMKILPEAAVDDGLFDVCIAADLTRLETLGALCRVYGGSHIGLPKVTCTRARRVKITSDTPLCVQADGELVGQVPVTLELAPQALRVATPQCPATATGAAPIKAEEG